MYATVLTKVSALSTLLFYLSAISPSAVQAGNGNQCGTCGWFLPNTTYLRQYKEFDFVTDIRNLQDLKAAGIEWTDTDAWRMGPLGPNGEQCHGKASNLKFAEDGLQLIYPGKPAEGKNHTGAEIFFGGDGRGMKNFIAVITAKADATPGTSQAFMTMPFDTTKGNYDEADLEILGAQLAKPNGGFRVTNHNPANATDIKRVFSKWDEVSDVDAPSALSSSFNSYGIRWTGHKDHYAKFFWFLNRFDGQLARPQDYLPRHTVATKLIVNHGTNGDAAFYGAEAPAGPVIMTIKSIKIWYTAKNVPGRILPGCQPEDICDISDIESTLSPDA